MKFDILTVTPESFDSYLNTSILARAQAKGLVDIDIHGLRDYTTDVHRTVDDHPYGGGAGMVLLPEPILKAFKDVKRKVKTKKTKTVVFSAKGKPFNQKMAYTWAKKYQQITFVSGRYEGIDERVQKILKAEEVSIGPYVLTDGDVATMVVISAVSRLLPGVIRFESLQEESFWDTLLKSENKTAGEGTLEYPHYTRPEVFNWQGKKYRVPKVLLSGNHAEIKKWRTEQAQKGTNKIRKAK